MIISEVSKKYGMTLEALCYYEQISLIPPVPHKPDGIGDYDDYSCRWIEFIHIFGNGRLSKGMRIFEKLFR